MSFVKCSVDGCSRKLQPILKVDPRDRETWFYRECDLCLQPCCEEHSAEIDGRIVCNRCQREQAAREPTVEIIELGMRPRSGTEQE